MIPPSLFNRPSMPRSDLHQLPVHFIRSASKPLKALRAACFHWEGLGVSVDVTEVSFISHLQGWNDVTYELYMMYLFFCLSLLDKLRRSMPNLVRAPSMPSVPLPTNPSASPCLLRNSQSFDSSSGLTRLQSSSKTPVLVLFF